MNANIMIMQIFYFITSKVIEGHKSSSNFSVNQTLPLLDGPLMLPPSSRSLFPSLSLTFSLYLPLLLYAKNNVHTTKSF